MGLVKNYSDDGFEEEIQSIKDRETDEFDCYEAQLHAVLANLDWLLRQKIPGPTRACAEYIRRDIEDLMR